METKVRASESTHWYKKDGTPCYKVEYADKKRKGEFRPTTKRDAKKLDLVPSVVGIINILRKPALEAWMKIQILESAYTCPLKRSEVDSDVWLQRVMEDAQEQARVAREKGIIKHAQIESYFKAQILPDDEEVCDQIQKINHILIDYKISGIDDIEPEKAFACDTFGGKMDLPALAKNIIFDVKTTEFTMKEVYKKNQDIPDSLPHKKNEPTKLHWPEHVLQLSGYALGNNLESPRLINIYVSTIDDSVHYHEWSVEEIENATEQFKLLVKLWWLNF